MGAWPLRSEVAREVRLPPKFLPQLYQRALLKARESAPSGNRCTVFFSREDPLAMKRGFGFFHSYHPPPVQLR